MSKIIVCSLKRLPKDRWAEAARNAVEMNPLNQAPLARLGMVMRAYKPTPMHLVAITTKYWGQRSPFTVGFLDYPAADLRKRG